MTNKLKPAFIFILLVTKKCQCYEDIYIAFWKYQTAFNFGYIPNLLDAPSGKRKLPTFKRQNLSQRLI